MTNTLAPRFTITNAITAGLTAIERARGFLDAATLSDEWVRRMSQRALLLEAHYTTHIEGTQLTIEQSERLWAGQSVPEAKADDVRELLNYRKAFNLVSDLTREITYTPPPPEDVAPLMRELVEWLRADTDIHPVLVAGIAQYQLVYIHPFLDGNGRTSRLLSTLCLYRAGYDFKRLFTLSQFYDRDRTAFYRAIQSVRDQDMELTGWLEFFVMGLAAQLREVVEKGKNVIRTDMIAQEYRLSPRQAMIIEGLLERLELRVEDLEKLLPRVNRRTLQRDLQGLVRRKIVKPVGAARAVRYRLRVKGL